MRILLVTNYGSFDSAYKFWADGVYPSNHLWGKIELEKEHGFKVDILPDLKNHKRLRKIGDKLGIPFLDRQLQMCWHARKYDAIYSPFLNLVTLISFFKVLKLIRTPVLTISHVKIIKDNLKGFKKLKWYIGKIRYNAIDKILFLGEKLYDDSLNCGLKKSRLGWINWGIDLSFYDKLREGEKLPAFEGSFVSTGKTHRDYKTVISAFSETPLKLAVYLPEDHQYQLKSNIISLADTTVTYNSVQQMAQIIASGQALLIPLTNVNTFFGLTSLLEALALGKPTISTRNNNFYFDIEDKQVGLWVEMGDKEGWKNAAEKINNDAVLRQQLSANALAYRHQFSMQIFAGRLNEELLKIRRK